MDSAVLVAFLGLALVLIPVPGPDFFFMLTTGMRYHAVLRPVAGREAIAAFLRRKWARDWEQVKFCSDRCRGAARRSPAARPAG